MWTRSALLATALLLYGCQRPPFSYTSAPGGAVPTTAPASASSPTDLGRFIFMSGNGGGTPGCVACHQGTALTGKTVSDIKICLNSVGPMIADFGPAGAAPLSDTQIANVAAYIASSEFPN